MSSCCNSDIDTLEESSSFQLRDGTLIDVGTDDTCGQEEIESVLKVPSPAIEVGVGTPALVKPSPNEQFTSPSQCLDSVYGKPNSPEKIQEIMMPQTQHGIEKYGGLMWKANLVPDNFDWKFPKNESLRMCSARSYDAANKCIKPRRGNLVVKSSDFFSSIVRISCSSDDFEIYNDHRQYRWVFSGVLNGWPALTTLEVLKIEYKKILGLNSTTHWDAEKATDGPTFPTAKGVSEVWAVLRAPPYTASGWSKKSPGYVFWFAGSETRDGAEPKLLYGTDMIRKFEKERIGHSLASPKCVKVHMISHRYATGDNQQIRDLLTYHSLALLEWDHGKCCTVVELAYLAGVAGYYGKANWLEDKYEPNNSLYRSFAPEMIIPWKDNLSEIRVYDVGAKNLEEHLAFMARHTGKDKRFLDVRHTFSHAVRLTFSSKEHIAQYLINYIRRGKTYSEIRRNCQTFAADFCAFLAGKKDVQPFHRINRLEYHNQTHYFLYHSHMYH